MVSQSRRARVVDVVLLVAQQESGSSPSFLLDFTTMATHHSGIPTHPPYGWLQAWNPHFRVKVSMGFSLLGVPLKYSRVEQASALYCGSRYVCWYTV
jgi:hypothetical protein